MDPQNPNSTDPNNPNMTAPNPGTTPPTPTSSSPIQPDLSNALGFTPPPVEPIFAPESTQIIPPSTPPADPNLNPPAPPAPDFSPTPGYTPPSWMNPTTATAIPPTPPNPMPDVNPTAPAPLDNPITLSPVSPAVDQTTAPVEPNPVAPPPVEPIPTYVPPAAPAPEPPAPVPVEPTPVGPNPITEASLPQSAPMDLSQLISNAQQQVQTEAPLDTTSPIISPSPSTETVVNATPVTTETTTTPSKGLPKWLIGVAAGLLVLVIGASAYFILGIGQSNTQTSLPATQNTRLSTPAPLSSPRSVIVPPVSVPASPSAQSFERLPATSAADLLRQRQQGR